MAMPDQKRQLTKRPTKFIALNSQRYAHKFYHKWCSRAALRLPSTKNNYCSGRYQQFADKPGGYRTLFGQRSFIRSRDKIADRRGRTFERTQHLCDHGIRNIQLAVLEKLAREGLQQRIVRRPQAEREQRTI